MTDQGKKDEMRRHARGAVPKGVALTMLRTQSESSMAPMMTPLLTAAAPAGSAAMTSSRHRRRPPPRPAAGWRSTHPGQIWRARHPKRSPLVRPPTRRGVDPLSLSVSPKKKGSWQGMGTGGAWTVKQERKAPERGGGGGNSCLLCWLVGQ
jgi:hypothetical protein